MTRKLNNLLKICVCIAGFGAFIIIAHAQESTSFQINPAHTGGLSTTTGFAPPLKRLWTLNLNAPISYPLIVPNMVIVNYLDQSGNNILDVVAAKTGHRLWKNTYPSARAISYAAYDDGLVFELGANGVLQAFQAVNGSIVWADQFSSNDGFNSPPVASGGFVYLTESSGTVYQVAERTGQVLWATATTGQSSASIAAGKAFVAGDCSVEALSVSFGSIIWDKNAGSDCNNEYNEVYSAVNIGNLVIVPQYNSNGGAIFDSKTGKFFRSGNTGVPATLNGLEYQENYLGIQASQVNNGTILWTSSIPNVSFVTAPIVVNESVYALSTQGTLYAIDAKLGTMLQKVAAGRGANQAAYSALTGLGAGQGILVVPSDNQLIAFAP